MKAALLFVALSCSAVTLSGQTPFSTDDTLKQLYHEYDPATKTAQWVCTQEQKSEGMHEGWPCTPENATVSVSVILAEKVPEGTATRFYIVTSAKPANEPGGEYNCHGCRPAVGAAVFVWRGQRWDLESASAAIEFSGGWGEPPTVDLIAIGPQKHGLLLTSDDLAQGFESTSKELLAPIGKAIDEVWGTAAESDDTGAFDSTDKDNSPLPYHSSATFRFISAKDVNGPADDYYNIEVVSHGTSWRGYGHSVTPENWIEIYTFKEGKYVLLRRTELAKSGRSGKNPSH
jgi:hypothetical protein